MIERERAWCACFGYVWRLDLILGISLLVESVVVVPFCGQGRASILSHKAELFRLCSRPKSLYQWRMYAMWTDVRCHF